MSARRYLIVFAVLCACEAPGEEAAGVGEACTESDLVEQCPPGSNPILGATAQSMCEASASVDLVTNTGSVSGRCFGEGTCSVVCQFASPCRCGVDAVTRDGVFCTPCDEAAACGNLICEGGETPESCPNDCAGDCAAGQERCQGTDRETCDGTGHWMLLECPAGTTCVAGADALTSCTRNDVHTGGETGEPVGREDRVDGRVWFGDGQLPPEGTGTAVVNPDLPGEYVLESVFFVGLDPNTRLPLKDIARAGYYNIQGAFGFEPLEAGGWTQNLFPADVDEGDHLVLWGPKRAVRFDLLGNTPPEGEPQVEVEYPADMAGDPNDMSRGLTSFSVYSQDHRRVLWARRYWEAGSNPHFLRGAELFLFDAATGENRSLGTSGIHTLATTPLALSADARTAVVPVRVEAAPSSAFLVYRDALARRPLVPSRRGEAATGTPSATAVSPSGALFAATGGGGAEPMGFPVSCANGVDLWNLANGKRIYTLCSTQGEAGVTASSLLFDPRGDRLSFVTGPAPGVPGRSMTPGIETWDLTQGKELSRIAVTAPPKIGHLPNGRGLLALVNDGLRSELMAWDPDTGAQLGPLFRWDASDVTTLPGNAEFPDPNGREGDFHAMRADGFVFSPRGTRLLVYGAGGREGEVMECVAIYRVAEGR